MITYVNAVNPGNFVAPSAPITIYGINKPIKYIRVLNNSPYQLSLNFGGQIVNLAEFWQKDVAVADYFQGFLTITPSIAITSSSHGQANQLTVQGLVESDGGGGLDAAIPQQAVTTTASGKPIFSATVQFAPTATAQQCLNIFNPANSGVTATFHAARMITNSNSAVPPVAIVAYKSGADLNLAGSVAANSHSGTPNPPISVMHCTSEDAVHFIGGVPPETLQVPQNAYQDGLLFPDNTTLTPGGQIFLQLTDASGKYVTLTLKWTEDTIVPPIQVTGATAVATQIDNSLLSPLAPVGTNLIKSVVPGPLTPVQLFNDGTGFYAVDQSGTLHRVFTFNSAGNPLQQGQAGDVMEFLGQMLVDQLAAFTGEIDPNKAPQTSNGSVSGTAKFYSAIWGTGLKIFALDLANYNSTGTPTFSFPSAISKMWYFAGNVGASPTFEFFNGGSGVTARIMTGFGATAAAGTDTPSGPSIHGDNIGHVTGPADNIVLGSTAATTINSVIIGIGV